MSSSTDQPFSNGGLGPFGMGLIGGVFLISGVAGLIYELIWFRMLANTFGTTGPAVAITTAGFMAGLGIGSQLMGRAIDRSRSPALIYALLEGSIALIAAIMGDGIRWVESAWGTWAGQDFSGGHDPVLLIGIFFLLVVPTALMGATLPVLAKAVVRKTGHLGRRFTWLYGMNTLGAACGAWATGFYLIPEWGIPKTTEIAIGLNLFAGFVVLVWALTSRVRLGDTSRDAAAPKTTDCTGQRSPIPRTILFAVFLTGFVGLACQYHWTRCLIFSFDRLKNTTYSFSAVLSVMLIALVLGTSLVYWFVDRLKSPVKAFSFTVAGIGASTIVSVLLMDWLPPLQDTIDPRTLQIDFAKAVRDVMVRSAIVIGLPATLMGASLPLAIRAVASVEKVGESIGRLYAWNTWGAVFGAVCGAYLMTPLFGLSKGLVVLGIMELNLALVLCFPRTGFRLGLVLCSALGVGIWQVSDPGHWSLSSLLPGERVLRHRDGPMASVSVIENERGERRINVDDVPVAGTSTIMQTDQKSLAHWSLFLSGNPRRALTVGFGSGGASYSFLLHDQLEHLDCVEICPDVPRFADLMTDANHGLLAGERDPRYRVILADARAYLRRTRAQYDAIVSDCTDLRYRSSANLYDLEYFELCRDRLTEQGCAVIWMPLGGLSPDAFRLTLRTFCRVFPDAGVFYLHNRWTHYVLLVGHRNPPQISVEGLKRTLAEEDVRRDLEEIGMTDPYKILATFLTSADQMSPLLAGNDLNTENFPILEFSVPKFDTGPWSAQRNLNLLRQFHSSVRPWLSVQTTSEDLEKIDRYQQAAHQILRAQEAERLTQVETATRAYLAALKLTPEDQAIAKALEFPELQRVAEEGQPTACLLLGRSRQIRGDFEQARDYFDAFRENLSRLTPPQNSEETQLVQQARAWAPWEEQWRAELRMESKEAGDENEVP